MQGKVHVAIGVAAAACLCYKYPNGFEFLDTNVLPLSALVTAAAGSYAPDIDNSRTHAGASHKITSKVVGKVGGGHRGITHTLLIPIGLIFLMLFIRDYLGMYANLASTLMSFIFGFNLGWLLHIFADLFNGKGVPLFWPLMKSKVHIMDLPSSGVGGWLFAIVCIGLMVICVAFNELLPLLSHFWQSLPFGG